MYPALLGLPVLLQSPPFSTQLYALTCMDYIKRLPCPLASNWAWLMGTPGRLLERGLPVMATFSVDFIPQLNITAFF